jgi:hypothetical protein
MGTHYVMLCLVFERHSSTFNVNLHDETSNSTTASSNLPIGLSGTRPGGGDLQYNLDTHTGVDPAWGDPIKHPDSGWAYLWSSLGGIVTEYRSRRKSLAIKDLIDRLEKSDFRV